MEDSQRTKKCLGVLESGSLGVEKEGNYGIRNISY